MGLKDSVQAWLSCSGSSRCSKSNSIIDGRNQNKSTRKRSDRDDPVIEDPGVISKGRTHADSRESPSKSKVEKPCAKYNNHFQSKKKKTTDVFPEKDITGARLSKSHEDVNHLVLLASPAGSSRLDGCGTSNKDADEGNENIFSLSSFSGLVPSGGLLADKTGMHSDGCFMRDHSFSADATLKDSFCWGKVKNGEEDFLGDLVLDHDCSQASTLETRSRLNPSFTSSMEEEELSQVQGSQLCSQDVDDGSVQVYMYDQSIPRM